MNPTSTSADSVVVFVEKMKPENTSIVPFKKSVEEMNPESTAIVPFKKSVGKRKENLESTSIVQKSVEKKNLESISIVPTKKSHETKEETESKLMESLEEINPIRQPNERKSSASPRPDSQNQPRGDLLENREHYNEICVPLYKASIKGDWKAAKVIFDKHPDVHLVAYAINENYDTPLHVVASCTSSKAVSKFVRNLVIRMSKEQLELKNDNDNTALCLAAAAGNLEVVMIMLCVNESLVDMPGRKGALPIYMASLIGDGKMVNYLYCWFAKNVSGDSRLESRSSVFLRCLEADIFDVALNMLIVGNVEISETLIVLARKRDALKGIKPCFTWRIIHRSFAIINVKVGLPAEKPSDAMKVLRLILETFMSNSKEVIDYAFIERQYEWTTKKKEDARQLLEKHL